ncbi:hypothetical protein CY34DRAFT_813578 [Suillus luteus UH-Slu-Lm8-n1]|uniref:Uncharacterized protein n=1 Tax=Suillus luteus UH-Slu-Lm8-n1 TaxID=930992 RepID=A0A0D0AGV2_9AGAM|nr:hypothetical protein CY34DRAFT_813578 [Suillus luteus UH-Slu-Lm8-n1]
MRDRSLPCVLVHLKVGMGALQLPFSSLRLFDPQSNIHLEATRLDIWIHLAMSTNISTRDSLPTDNEHSLPRTSFLCAAQ